MTKDCRYCGDPDFEADLWPVEVLEDDDTEGVQCRSGGCGLFFTADEIDPEDIAFGFSIVTEDEL